VCITAAVMIPYCLLKRRHDMTINMVIIPDSSPNNTIAYSEFPVWARAKEAPVELEEAAFIAGAALASLNSFARITGDNPPMQLWRQRLALLAAAEIVQRQGRREDEAELRDSCYLTKAGDDPGPAGHILADWRQLGRVNSLKPSVWQKVAAEHLPQDYDDALHDAIYAAATKPGGAVTAAAHLSALILHVKPGAESLALWLADAILAHRLKWWAPVPLLPMYIKRRDLRLAPAYLEGDKTWLKICYVAYTDASAHAYNEAIDLNRRTQKFNAVLNKLRARGAESAIQKFLTEDAVSPVSLTRYMTERSARRLCERLVSLGVVRELTGRSTFRLYGL